MKLPVELDPRRKNTMFTLSDIEAIVRDCAKEALNEVGIRKRTPREIANDILARYGLEAE